LHSSAGIRPVQRFLILLLADNLPSALRGAPASATLQQRGRGNSKIIPNIIAAGSPFSVIRMPPNPRIMASTPCNIAGKRARASVPMEIAGALGAALPSNGANAESAFESWPDFAPGQTNFGHDKSFAGLWRKPENRRAGAV
jgi:hypothetical protein